MAEYKYQALDEKGNEQSGMIEAPDSKVAITRVRELGLFPTKVRRTAGRETTPYKPPPEPVIHSPGKPPGFIHPNESVSVSDKDFLFPEGSFKCKLRQGIESASGYLNIFGQQGEVWLIFESRGTRYSELAHLTINLRDIQDVQVRGFFRKSLTVYTHDGRTLEFIGHISRLASILQFEIAYRNQQEGGNGPQ